MFDRYQYREICTVYPKLFLFQSLKYVSKIHKKIAHKILNIWKTNKNLKYEYNEDWKFGKYDELLFIVYFTLDNVSKSMLRSIRGLEGSPPIHTLHIWGNIARFSKILAMASRARIPGFTSTCKIKIVPMSTYVRGEKNWKGFIWIKRITNFWVLIERKMKED